MRLVTYEREGARRLGALVDGHVIDMPEAVADPSFPTSMEALVAAGREALGRARTALAGLDPEPRAVAGARLLVPLLPGSLRDFLAFEDHVRAGSARRGEEEAYLASAAA